MSTKSQVLARAQFNPLLATYFMLQMQVALFFSIITIPLMPIWYFIGRGVHKRQYESYECELTTRTLNFKAGYIFKVQKNIPLDKITDLAVNEGPLLRYFGMCSLVVETAGGGQTAATGHARLPGLVNAIEFRDRVLEQRDAIVLDGAGSIGASEGVARAATPAGSSEALLVDIRDTLRLIEKRLGEIATR